jgi:glycosyltransferase involved in cell wall biosynthesis
MRVLHLLKTNTGARWALRQIAVLQQLGIEVVVAMPQATAGLASEYRRAGATVVGADLDFTARDPHKLRSALRVCRALVNVVQPDLIHSHFVSTTLVARLALGRFHAIPRIFQVPGPLHLEHPAFALLDRLSAGPRDSWIGSCRWTCERYRQLGVPSRRVFLSYYGTDMKQVQSRTRGVLRREFGLDRNAALVGLVAYLYAPKRYLGQRRGLKGHEDFLAAIERAAPHHPALRGMIVGGPWGDAAAYEARLRALATGLPVTFTGVRSDIPSVYADLQVAVHPSLSENCGGAVESLAAGVPTIATNVGGLPDVVIDGDTGWLVPPRDPARLATVLLDVLRHPLEARRRAARGQDLVRHLFDVQRTAREVADVYHQALRQEPVRTVLAG